VVPAEQEEEESEAGIDRQVVPAEPKPKRKKCSREVQVMLNCSDRADGFNRSVTAQDYRDVPELRKKLLELKARARLNLNFQEVAEALHAIRERFARPPGGILENLKAKPREDAQPLGDEAVGGASEDAGPRKRKRTPARKAAGRAKALKLKRLGKGLFAKKKVSPQLKAVIGCTTVSHIKACQLLWKYIKDNGLNEKKIIWPDAKLKKVCPESRFNMCKLHQFLKQHLK